MKKALMMLGGVGLGAGLMYLFDPEAGSRRRALATAAGRGLGRALADVGLKRMLGIGAWRRPVIIQKTMTIRAPVDRVFDFWTKYGNVPSFMKNMRNTRITGDERTRWMVFSPSGAPMGWDAKLVTQIPSKSVTWEAVTISPTLSQATVSPAHPKPEAGFLAMDAPLPNLTRPPQARQDAPLPGRGSETHRAGTVRFIDNGDGTTTVNLRMRHYPPPEGPDRSMPALPDVKARLNEDLRRMKIAIESGIVPVEDRQAFGTAGGSHISLQAS